MARVLVAILMGPVAGQAAAEVGTRFQTEKCFSDDRVYDYLIAQQENTRDIDRVRRPVQAVQMKSATANDAPAANRCAFVNAAAADYNSRPCCGVEQSGSSSGS